MKKSRIFIAAGTVVLAIASILATKANKTFKFAAVSLAYCEPGASLYTIKAPTANGLFLMTTTGSGNRVQANVDNTSLGDLYTTSNLGGSTKVYYKP